MADDRTKLLTKWEKAVEGTPGQAWAFGCPNWLALEEWDGKEEFQKAANRVRDRYFPSGDPRLHVTHDVTQTGGVTRLCAGCGEGFLGRGSRCGRCRMRRSRDGR